MVVHMPAPKPPTGALQGKDGTILMRGSSGHIAPPVNTDLDPYANRCNETGLDYFSDTNEY